MMYLLIKAGIKQSKKPLPPHLRRRQPLQMRTLAAARPNRELEVVRIWPAQGVTHVLFQLPLGRQVMYRAVSGDRIGDLVLFRCRIGLGSLVLVIEWGFLQTGA